MLLREGLEMQLSVLEDAFDEARPELGDAPRACAICFELDDNCRCIEPELWPVQYVIARLRWTLIHNYPCE